MKRVFIGIAVPKFVQQKLSWVEKELTDTKNLIAWVPQKNWHVTLAFIGEVDRKKLEKIKDCLGKLTLSSDSFELSVHKIGGFPDLVVPKNVWFGVAGDLELLTLLHQQVVLGLRSQGIPFASGNFTPHITLGRVRKSVHPTERMEIGRRMQELSLPKQPVCWKVMKCVLFESILGPIRAEYRKLEEYTF